jgi:hypothetical protein
MGARFLARRLVPLLVLLSIAVPARSAPYVPGDDLPTPGAHFETIPAGSLVIPMDHTLQAVIAPFNLKAYGLVNNLLQNSVPLKWAIKAGKAKDAVDFAVTAQRIYPTVIAAALVNFSGGPFIVHRDFAVLAKPLIAAFGNSVAVYETTADVVVDIRYDLTHKPRIAVSNTNTAIHTAIFTEAGIPAANYSVVDPATLTAASCYTSHSEPHTTLTPGVAAVKLYVQSGANFLAQCKASLTYENDAAGHFQTTLGTAINNLGNVLSYPNADLAYSQFTGALNPAPGGSEQDWKFAAGSAWQNNGHVHADNVAAAPATWAATASKLINAKGGNVYYLGGHNYGGSAALDMINGRRMFLNFIFVPSDRPAVCNLDITPVLRTISGTVYEDVNGDSGLGDGVARPGVRLRLYTDANDNGLVDAGDVYLAEATTDVSGNYSFQVSTTASGNKYLVAADSKSVTASAGLNGGSAQGDVWSEQTRGDNPATAALDVGPRFGGRTPGTSDVYAASTVPASNNYQHLARADVTAASVGGAHFAFSFNVVTHARAGDGADDDVSANRTVQGSLRQFIQNATAVAGANVMRFVPAVATNASGGGGNWWRIGVTVALQALADVSTTIDGRAYSSADGTTVRDDNTGVLGAGGTVGVDALALSTVARPELEIQDLRSTAVVNVGLDITASSCAVRRIALFGFGGAPDQDAHANLRVGAAANNAAVEENIIGAAASSFADPGAAARSGGDCVRSLGGDTGTVRNNLVGFCAGTSVALKGGSNSWLVENNEIRGSAVGYGHLDGVAIETASGSATVRGNLITGGDGTGIDTKTTGGSSTIVNNTVTGNGIGLDPDAGGVAVEPSGISLYGTGNVVDRNVINANFGAGVMVVATASGNRITRNSIYLNGTILNRAGAGPKNQIGIDLLAPADNQSAGTAPFVTLNDLGDGDSGGNALLNYPVLVSAIVAGPNLVVRGFARPGSTVEVFIADPDPSGFGEGRTYLFSAVEGGGSDSDSGSGSYGPGPVNGIVQGSDTTNRFTFSVPLPPGVAVGTVLTATATDGSANTSEFSGQVSAAGWSVVKRGFLLDGTAITNGAVLPKGARVRFLLYLDNPGGAVSDVSLGDVLAPGFAYVAGSLRYANTAANCASATCTPAEESAILAAALAGAAGTDAVDGDVVSAVGVTVRAGNQVVGNLQLDIAAAKVWAVVLTVRMQ